MSLIRSYFEEAASLLEAFYKDANAIAAIEKAGQSIVNCIHTGGKIISCGNGGSMSDAMHFAEEMTGKFRNERKSLPAIAISDPAYLTCTANDYGFQYVFSRFIEGIGKTGDVLLALSTSGNSLNIVEAATTAKRMGMKVIGLTGNDGGRLASLCDVEIRAPHSKYADHCQEIHIKVIHALILYIESKLI